MSHRILHLNYATSLVTIPSSIVPPKSPSHITFTTSHRSSCQPQTLNATTANPQFQLDLHPTHPPYHSSSLTETTHQSHCGYFPLFILPQPQSPLCHTSPSLSYLHDPWFEMGLRVAL
ncbi:unnamed protein product [Sphenostylis stenocarpa]|uniref:Uncharacterized protein n=1 Tax=Sphenostylis stenocarpa TaxID=92480 RepID=A0AA86VT05_9FABA|nr:unnamed protein product [Sphenostylis stenocarpa]